MITRFCSITITKDNRKRIFTILEHFCLLALALFNSFILYFFTYLGSIFCLVLRILLSPLMRSLIKVIETTTMKCSASTLTFAISVFHKSVNECCFHSKATLNSFSKKNTNKKVIFKYLKFLVFNTWPEACLLVSSSFFFSTFATVGYFLFQQNNNNIIMSLIEMVYIWNESHIELQIWNQVKLMILAVMNAVLATAQGSLKVYPLQLLKLAEKINQKDLCSF